MIRQARDSGRSRDVEHGRDNRGKLSRVKADPPIAGRSQGMH